MASLCTWKAWALMKYGFCIWNCSSRPCLKPSSLPKSNHLDRLRDIRLNSCSDTRRFLSSGVSLNSQSPKIPNITLSIYFLLQEFPPNILRQRPFICFLIYVSILHNISKHDFNRSIHILFNAPYLAKDQP